MLPAATQGPGATPLLLQVTGQARDRARAVNRTGSAQQLAQAAQDPSAKVRYRVARNKAVTPEILHLLAHDTDKDVRYACATNQQLTPDDMLYLAQTGTELYLLEKLASRKDITPQVAANVVRNVDEFTNKNNATRVLRTMAANPQLDKQSAQLILDWATQHPNTRVGDIAINLLRHEQPIMTEQQTAQAISIYCAAYSATTPHDRYKFEFYPVRYPLPPETLQGIYQLTKMDNLLSHKSLSWEQAETMGRGTASPVDRTASLLARPDCPPEFVRSCNPTNEKVATALAKRRDCPADIQAALARSPYDSARSALAKTCRDSQLLQQLAGNPNSWTRQCVAKNRHTPHTVLAQLASDSEQNVRHSVTENPTCPLDILEQLMRDEISWVAASAALHKNVPRHVQAMWQLIH